MIQSAVYTFLNNTTKKLKDIEDQSNNFHIFIVYNIIYDGGQNIHYITLKK